jgi:chromosome segregation ATPase
MKPVSHIFRFLFLFALLVLLHGCVAKKKFVAMEESRNRAENRVVELTNKTEQLESDFNDFKNDFHYSNSIKDSYIDSLNKEILRLNNNMVDKVQNIDEQVLSFQVEKRRLNQMLADKDREIRDLKNDKALTDRKIKELQNNLQSSQISLREATSQQNTLQSQLTQRNSEIERTKSSLDERVAEINKLHIQLAEKDDRIEVLENQVKLLRSQLGID